MSEFPCRRTLAIVAVFVAAGCATGRSEESWLDLKIRKPDHGKRELFATLAERKEAARDGFVTGTYFVPLEFYYYYAAPTQRSSGSDWLRSQLPRDSLRSSRDFLETYGIKLPEGTEKRYDPDTEVFEVTTETSQLDLIEKLFEAFEPWGDQNVKYLFELFELESTDAQRLEESTEGHADHESERKKAHEFLRSGKARLVDSISLYSRSGGRSLMECRVGSLVDNTAPSKHPPQLQVVVDSVLGGNDEFVDAGFTLEGREDAFPAEGELVARYHVQTQAVLSQGASRLVGGWSSGHSGERRCLAFLTCHLENVLASSEAYDPGETRWIEVPETDLFTARFFVPHRALSGFLRDAARESANGSPTGGPVDPFSADTRFQNGRMSPEEWMDWKFASQQPTGRRISYDVESQILSLTHKKEILKFAELILPAVEWLDMRLEIFQIPALLALRLEQSAAEGIDHRPELEKVRELLLEREGDSDFRSVAVVHLPTPPVFEGMIATGESVPSFRGYEVDRSSDPPTPRPVLESQMAGTVLEVEVVKPSDEHVIDIDLNLEHHTAPPVEVTEDVVVPGRADPIPTKMKQFHRVKIEGWMTFLDGQSKLIGSWRPRGDAEAEKRDLRQIAFLTVKLKTSLYP